MGKLYAPGEVARQLGISTSTLRRWAKTFASHLSATAREPQQQGLRYAYYNEEDLRFLRQIHQWRKNGYSYAELPRILSGKEQPPLVATMSAAIEPVGGTEIALANDASAAVAIWQGTIQALNDGQQLLLNSQQQTRQLVSVIAQDNFNLKTENRKLRERILALERELHQSQRHQQQKQEMISAQLAALEALVQKLSQA